MVKLCLWQCRAMWFPAAWMVTAERALALRNELRICALTKAAEEPCRASLDLLLKGVGRVTPPLTRTWMLPRLNPPAELLQTRHAAMLSLEYFITADRKEQCVDVYEQTKSLDGLEIIALLNTPSVVAVFAVLKAEEGPLNPTRSLRDMQATLRTLACERATAKRCRATLDHLHGMRNGWICEPSPFVDLVLHTTLQTALRKALETRVELQVRRAA